MRYEDAPKVVQDLYREEVAREPSRLPGEALPNVAEATLVQQLAAHKILDYRRDYPQKSRDESWPAPITRRKWEADFAWTEIFTEVAPCEYDPMPRSLGVWIHGQAHGQRGTGKLIGDGLNADRPGVRSRDYEAANVLHQVLVPLGWTLWTFSPQQVGSLVALESIKAWLACDEERMVEALQGKP